MSRSVGWMTGNPAREVTEFSLENSAVRVAVWNYGATLVAVETPDGTGRRRNIIVRLSTVAAYASHHNRAYVGATLGRFARLVAGGDVDIDGHRYQLQRNAKKHHIHGGLGGFDSRLWQGHAYGGAKSGRITLALVSPNGDQGYPGTLIANTTYQLDIDNRLAIQFTARTDTPTLCGLSNHAFWNLTDEADIDSHQLGLSASEVVEADADFVPTGRLLPVTGTEIDFQVAHPIGSTRIDAFFAVNNRHPAATLCDPASGIRISLNTDQTGMAVYTGDYLPARPRAGICLQPGAWPIGPDTTNFPSSVLRPGQIYRSRTIFTLQLPNERLR